MSVFILEDDVLQGERIKSLIREVSTEIGFDSLPIFLTAKPDRLLEQLVHSSQMNLYFLDIELKDEALKGLEVAQKIRELDSHGVIVFVTTHSELAPISYQYMVSALTFIEKRIALEDFREAVKACLQAYQQAMKPTSSQDIFIYETSNTTIRLDFSEIDYIMTAEPHRLEMVTDYRVIRFYGELKEIESLDARLVRCHQSYIVNTQKIIEVATKERQVILASGQKLPVSRRLIKPLKAKWLESLL